MRRDDEFEVSEARGSAGGVASGAAAAAGSIGAAGGVSWASPELAANDQRKTVHRASAHDLHIDSYPTVFRQDAKTKAATASHCTAQEACETRKAIGSKPPDIKSGKTRHNIPHAKLRSFEICAEVKVFLKPRAFWPDGDTTDRSQTGHKSLGSAAIT
jgi:hypothetical protein